jgi:hypothetical protein
LIGNGLHDLSLLKGNAFVLSATLANLMILNATIYCTVVTPDTSMVFSVAPWFSSTCSFPETLLSTPLRLRARQHLAAQPAGTPARHNFTIWNAAIYWTRVLQNIALADRI